MPVGARYAYPAKGFVADPRGYDYAFRRVYTAVETASVMLAQCPDGARETFQTRQL